MICQVTSLFKKNGFSLLEVIVVITISGIIMGISIPSYRTYVNKTKQMECDQEAYVLQQAIYQEIAVHGNTRNGKKYPLTSGYNSENNIGYDNFTVSSFKNYLTNILVNNNLIPLKENGIIDHTYEQAIFTENSSIGNSIYTINYKVGIKITVYIKVYDNVMNKLDYAYFTGFKYVHSNGKMTDIVL